MKIKILLLTLLLLIPIATATDIAYVVKDTSRPDSNFIQIINELDYTYDLIDDSKVSKTNFSEYSMILVGNERITNIPVEEHPSMVVNPYYYEYWSYQRSTKSAGNQALRAYNYEHFITNNQEQEIQIYTSCCEARGSSLPVYYLKGKKQNCEKITTLGDSSIDSGYYVIAYKEEPRRIFFGITESDYWTPQSRDLFKNSVQWIVGGQDEDGDGYTKNEDCNDQNPYIHPDAEEIINNIDENCINDPPILVQEISDINIPQETLENAIDLNNHFKDPEGDTLTFTITETSNNQNIIVNMNNGIIDFEILNKWTGTDWIVFKAEDSEEYTLSNKININVNLKTCSELGGDICSENEICNDWLNQEDNCCSTTCKKNFSFTKIERYEKNSEIEVEIKDPREDEIFKVSDKIDFRVEIDNNALEDLDFDVDVYLYDLTNQDIVEEYDFSIDIDDEKRGVHDLEIPIPEDIDEENDYVIFVKAKDGNYYNEDYAEIKIKREEKDIVINKFTIEPESGECGNPVKIKIETLNLGTKDQNIYIKIRNSDLKINEQSEEFDLEEYRGNNKEITEFLINIPETEEGEYSLNAYVYFEGDSHLMQKQLEVKCNKKESNSTESLTNNLTPAIVEKQPPNYIKWLAIYFAILLAAVFTGIFIFWKKFY